MFALCLRARVHAGRCARGGVLVWINQLVCDKNFQGLIPCQGGSVEVSDMSAGEHLGFW